MSSNGGSDCEDESYEDRVFGLEDDIDRFMEEYEDNAPDTQDAWNEYVQEDFLDLLECLAQIIFEAETEAYPLLQELIQQVDVIFNKAVAFAYQEDLGPYNESHMPSFSHIDETALLQDEHKSGQFSHGFVGQMLPHLDKFVEIFSQFSEPGAPGAEELKALMLGGQTPAWKKTVRLHPLSTPCSRFVDNIPEWTPTALNNRATSVFQARCEVTSDDIHNPIEMRLSSSGNILALSSMGGWKNRTPYLYYYLPNEERNSSSEFMKKHGLKTDLTSTFQEMMIDDERRLIFAADWDRIKSYRCNDPAIPKNQPGGRVQRVHTMASKGYDGPLAMLANGRVARAGNGKIAVWELDSLQTHGDSGMDIIGNAIKEDDLETWRDDPESIEKSTGSDISTVITLLKDNSGDEDFVIGKWHSHPLHTNTMLCGTDQKSHQYYCHTLDFEAGGKMTTRYLGHGGTVDGFSTSAGDMNTFLTWCSDGYARLYDVRHPLPVLTFAAGEREPMPAAVLAHPDGIPFVFTGTETSEHIKLWDVRARAYVYQLATGNNAVVTMEWDANVNALYAATMCPHIDRNGHHLGYRPARIPKVRNSNGSEDDKDDDEDREDEIERESEDICWPSKAHQAENYFGHVFDAGDHRIFKYSFKTEPNLDILPYYGSASLGQEPSFW